MMNKSRNTHKSEEEEEIINTKLQLLEKKKV